MAAENPDQFLAMYSSFVVNLLSIRAVSDNLPSHDRYIFSFILLHELA